MGGNGVAGCQNQTFYGIPTNDAPLIKIPKGTGGGCVTSAPFKDWSVNLGPVFSDLTCTPPNPITNFTDANFGLGPNSRCLKRDISAWTSSQWTNDEMVTKLLNSTDMKTFWTDMQGGDPAFSNNFIPQVISRPVVIQGQIFLRLLETHGSTFITPKLIAHGGPGKT
jgi:tyrosinase